jgi:integrase
MATRARSKVPQFRVRVPATVVDRLRGKQVLLYLSFDAGPPFVVTPTIGDEVAFSLGTKDAVVAAARNDAALDHLRRLFDMMAMEPVKISHKDLVAYSGEVYRAYVAFNEADPGESMAWRMHKALHRATLEGRIANPPAAILSATDASTGSELFGTGDLTEAVDALPAGQHDGLEDRFGLLADWVLIRHRLHLTAEDRQRFLRLIGTASLDAGWQLKRNSEGDYSPDPKAARFPPIQTVTATKPKATIDDIFNDWWTEAEALGRKKRTRAVYRSAIDRLIESLGHTDAARVTEDDMLAFKKQRLKAVSAKTFIDADVPGIKSVFGWACDNRKIASNPALVLVKLRRPKKARVRPKWFTSQEAAAIFRACLSVEQKAKEDTKTWAAKRWVPIIAAYTGCRIGEALQLRKADIFEESGYHVFRITPEAGDVKTNELRLVPIHEHLIELGFLEFVEQSADGHLFAKGSYKRVYDFIREVVTDPAVAPNHGWRHFFTFVAIDLGIEARIYGAIQGHAPRTAGESYGDVSVRAMARAIAQIPRIEWEKDRDANAPASETEKFESR